jgi:hypothetical protein
MSVQAARHVCGTYYETTLNPITQHHIDSFNDLLERRIPVFLKASNPIQLVLDAERSIRFYMGGRDGTKILYRPPVDELENAVTPNICPAEVRTFFNRIPGPQRDACARFMRRWMDFIRENFDLWKHTAIVGDAPGIGAMEIYAHTKADRGFVCLVNQNPFPRTARFRLDQSVGLTTGEKFFVTEIYPKECPLAEQALPWSARGQELVCDVPPHSVRSRRPSDLFGSTVKMPRVIARLGRAQMYSFHFLTTFRRLLA